MTSPASNSHEQTQAERLILDSVEKKVNQKLTSGWLTFGASGEVQVDGVSSDGSVLVEVFAHQGHLKSGQRHKIAGDALKLITLAKDRVPRPELILAFADESIAVWAAGKSWLATSLAVWNIEVVVAELDPEVRAGLRAAQARQVMVSPGTSALPEKQPPS
jgi:hypothetical protein